MTRGPKYCICTFPDLEYVVLTSPESVSLPGRNGDRVLYDIKNEDTLLMSCFKVGWREGKGEGETWAKTVTEIFPSGLIYQHVNFRLSTVIL